MATSPSSGSSPVLVTGGSGFVASHLVLRLLRDGYTVRTTVRSLAREPDVRAALQGAGADADDLARLSFHAADLTADEGWADAVQGCAYVHHVASPFPPEAPKSDDELIVPAREGTLRVLRAARDAGTVRRVVFTSSFATIGYGHPDDHGVFTERDWSVVEALPAYHKSKTLAERAAWDFIADEGGALELSVVNPVGIFGPVLGADFSASLRLVKRMLDGTLSACPQMYFGVVDVRDLADLHMRAMVDPAAKGERFLGVADGPLVSVMDVAGYIRPAVPEAYARKVPTRTVPNWVLRFVALFNATAAQVVPMLGKKLAASNEKAKSVLGWAPRPVEETFRDTAESFIRLGLV